MLIGAESYKKAIQIASAFAFAAALAFIANIVVATATEMQRLSPTATGIEAIDKNRTPPSLRIALAGPRICPADAMVAAGQLSD